MRKTVSAASAAAKRRWRNNPAARQRHADLLRGRKFTPREPPPLPAQVQQFERQLVKQRITVIGESRAFGYNYPNAWMISACDPDAGAVFHRWDRVATACRLEIKQFKSDPLLTGDGVAVACLVLPKEQL